MTLQPYQERLIEEHKDIEEKRKRILVFLETKALQECKHDEIGRLHRQYEIMGLYSQILSERIIQFKKPEPPVKKEAA